MNRFYKILFFFTFSSVYLSAQPAFLLMQKTEYVARYKDIAIKQMMEYGVPASITLAQAVVESQYGNSPLALSANNHFGIKCKSTWTGPSFTLDDDEANECFRKYKSVEESFVDHSVFLTSRKWYKPLFELNPTDYKAWAYGLKQAGYATHPQYAEMLIDVIEDLELYRYDKYLMYSPTIQPKSIAEQKNLKIKLVNERLVYYFNGSKYIEAKNEDSFTRIALEFNIELKDLLYYNDLIGTKEISKNERIYIKTKRRHSRNGSCIASGNETLRDIAQKNGVKLNYLQKLNKIKDPGKIAAGTVICLSRKCSKTKP